MRIVLESEHAIRLVPDDEAFGFDARDAGLSPFHLLAAALATCTYSVLLGWAQHAELGLEDLEIGVTWEIGEDPVRVTGMDMEIHWPTLPPDRRDAAVRAAAHCTVHHTLSHPTPVETRMADPDGDADREAGQDPGAGAGAGASAGARASARAAANPDAQPPSGPDAS